MKLYFYILFLFLSSLSISKAQPSFIFQGGSGNGYQSSAFNNPGNIFLLNGGSGNGYASIDLKSASINILVTGGNGNGYILSQLSSPTAFLFQGGEEDGYALSLFNTTSDATLYTGGDGNGYDMYLDFREFIWTGAVGTGWNVADNWNYLTIPDINRTAIIPADAINWPFINDGIFAIGSNPNLGAFTAKQVWIQQNAQLFTRVNSIVENYGQLRIDGFMEVRNPIPNSFLNSGKGQISIGSTGQLIFVNQ